MRIKIKYLVLIAIGALLTPTAIDMAFDSRGYVAVGSECLLVLLFPLMGIVVDSFKEMMRSMNND